MAERTYTGSQIIPVRIAADLLDQIDAIVAASAPASKGEPWTRSSWIKSAIQDKLDHYARSRASSARRRRKTKCPTSEVSDGLVG